jgi:hypothetical protein
VWVKGLGEPGSKGSNLVNSPPRLGLGLNTSARTTIRETTTRRRHLRDSRGGAGRGSTMANTILLAFELLLGCWHRNLSRPFTL